MSNKIKAQAGPNRDRENASLVHVREATVTKWIKRSLTILQMYDAMLRVERVISEAHLADDRHRQTEMRRVTVRLNREESVVSMMTPTAADCNVQ